MQKLRLEQQSESSGSDANSPLNLVQTQSQTQSLSSGSGTQSGSGSRSGLSSRSLDDEPKKRSHIRVACNSCRAKKLKCNGDRPTCTACQDRNVDCVYEGDPSSTRLDNLKRKTAALEEENQDLRSLVNLIRSRPQHEVENIVSRLRAGDGVRTAMDQAQPGHVLSRVMSDGIDAQTKAGLASRFPTDETHDLQNRSELPPHLKRSSPSSSSQRDKRMDISMVLVDGDRDLPSQPHARGHPPNQ